MHLASDKKRLSDVQLLAFFFLAQPNKEFYCFYKERQKWIKKVLTFLMLATEINSNDCCHN